MSLESEKNNPVSVSQSHPSSPIPYGWYPPPYPEEEEINLLDYLNVIKKHWLKIFIITLLGTLITGIIAFRMTKIYRAEASLMLLTQSGGGGLAALSSQLSSIPLVGGQLSGLGGGTNKSTQLIAILKSRTLLEKIVAELDLSHVFFKEKWDFDKKQWKPDRWSEAERNGQKVNLTAEAIKEDTVLMLQKGILKVEEDKKTSLINLKIEYKDPELAAALINRLIVELQDFVNKNSLTVAKRNRLFVEKQLQINKIELLEFGKKLNQFYSANRVSNIQSDIDVNVGKIPEPPKTFEEFRSHLEELEQQKGELDAKLSEAEKTGIVRNVPSQVYLQYLTLQLEVLKRVNGLLVQQYETAKIDEAKEDLSFQVIDKAVVPVRPYKPQKKLMVAIAFVGSFFMSVFLAFFLEYFRKLKEKNR